MSFEEKLYPTGVGISANLVMVRHHEILKKYGLETFLKKHEFKRAREMYQTAIYALGMSSLTDKHYWITPCDDNTPDCYLIWKDETGLVVEQVEVTIYDYHTKDIWEVIKKKLAKQYPKQFCIVIHDSNENQEASTSFYKQIHSKLKDMNVGVGAIRLWTAIKNKEPNDILLIELYPDYIEKEFSLTATANNCNLTQHSINIDVQSKRSRITFAKNDLDTTLPELPDFK